MSWEEDFEEEDFPDEHDETFSIPCSNCGAEVYEDCEMCPQCGEYIIRSTSPWEGRPQWYVGLAIMGTIAVIAAMLLMI